MFGRRGMTLPVLSAVAWARLDAALDALGALPPYETVTDVSR